MAICPIKWYFSFFKFKELGEIINKNASNYIISILYGILACVVGGVLFYLITFIAGFVTGIIDGNNLLNVALIISIIFNSIINTYLFFVYSYLIANSINNEAI